MNFWSNIFDWGRNKVERFRFRLFNTTPIFNTYGDDLKKLQIVFSNPAVLKVIALQCDLFSLGQVRVKDKDGIDVPDDPAVKLMQNPNPLQNQTQFLWDFMFWNMLGNDYCYVDSNIVDKANGNKLYFLEPQKLDWPTSLSQTSDHLILSNKKLSDVMDTIITYRYNNGVTITFPLKKLICIADLTNGTGNWFKGNSRIEALYKVISNSDAALDAKNINVRYSGKFMVAGQQDPENVNQLPLSEPEKKDIESKMNGEKSVHAFKSMIDVKRFVENLGNLKLDEAFLADYYIIGTMYNIPRDVLEAYASSTYENQEKARASHVAYTLDPKGSDFTGALAKRFGYEDKNLMLYISWSHLPFMQVFEREKAETQKLKSVAFANFLNAGVTLDEVNAYLGTNFKSGERNYVASTEVIKPAKGEQQSAAA